MLFGETLRQERERAGLSREQLRRRILRHFESAPSVNAIRDIENGRTDRPQGHNLVKLFTALSALKDAIGSSR
jgi:transcriptional regulator with XRE-family HTH domain